VGGHRKGGGFYLHTARKTKITFPVNGQTRGGEGLKESCKKKGGGGGGGTTLNYEIRVPRPEGYPTPKKIGHLGKGKPDVSSSNGGRGKRAKQVGEKKRLLISRDTVS